MAFIREHARPLMIMVAALVTATFLVGTYVLYYIDNHQEHLEFDADRFKVEVRRHADATFVRIKDVAAFVAAGADERIQLKLSRATRLSGFMTHLGYVRIGQKPVAVVGRDLLSGGLLEDSPLVSLLLSREGLVYAATRGEYPELFSRISTDGVVMLQAMRLADGSVLVSYAALDIRSMLKEAAGTLTHANIRGARLKFADSEMHIDVLPNDTPSLDAIEYRFDAPEAVISANLSIVGELQDRVENFALLIIVVLGLVIVEAAAVVLFILQLRDQDRNQARLRAAAKAAEEASESKSLFLANMSHEIRTPLNGVLGMAELISRTPLDSHQARYVKQITSSGNTLLALLNDILDLSKLDSDQLAIDPVPVRLHDLLSDVAGFVAPIARDKGLAMVLDIEPELALGVEVDPTRLRQILSNLLSNAVKFTETGWVRLTVRDVGPSEDSDKRLFRFAIEDTGIGISDEARGKLFSRFVQAESNTTRLYGGTGLGLAISKTLCERMGGSIGVNSTPGEGSCFWFNLPMQVLDDGAPEQASGLRVAFISSDPWARQSVPRLLAASGVEARLFDPQDDVQKELDALASSRGAYDVVIVDEACGRDHAHALAVMIGAHANGLAVKRMLLSDQPLGAGSVGEKYRSFDLVLPKPFLPSQLVRSLRHLVRNDVEALEAEGQSDTKREAGQKSALEGVRVLLVDDNQVNILFGEDLLLDMGCEVTTAFNGREAVDACRADTFDIVLMDCQMPVMDGYQATAQLRQLEAASEISHVPIIALTANALKGDREKCLIAGMDEFLAKPLRGADLEATMQRVLQAREPVAAPPAAPPAQAIAAEPPPEPAPKAPRPAAAPDDTKEIEMTDTSAPQPQDEHRKIPLIDEAVFSQSRANVRSFDKLLAFYLTDTVGYLTEIREALSLDEMERVTMPAHTIKSSSRIVGAEGLASLAENLEKRARSGDPAQLADMRKLSAHMDKVFDLTREKIEALHPDARAA